MRKRKVGFLDPLIVFLNIAAGRGNMLSYWLLRTSDYYVFPAVVIFLDLAYLFFRREGCNHPLTYRNGYIIPWLIWIILLFSNFFNLFFKFHGRDLPTFEYLLLVFLFFLILNRQASSIRIRTLNLSDGVYYMSKGYIWLSMISIIGIISSFVLYRIGLAGDIPFSADILTSNEGNGAAYSRVFMSVRYARSNGLFDEFVRVPFFQDDGIFCGLFHEPHIIAYNVFPCFILLLAFYNKLKHKFLIILAGVLIMLFAGSATNVLVVLACLSFYLLIIVGRENVGSMIIGGTVVLLAILVFISIDDTFFMFVVDRLDGGNASNEASRSLLAYAFSPESLTGFNFLSTEFLDNGVKQGKDVGYIAFILNIIFLFFYVRNTVKLVQKKDSIAIAVGLASLYCILHSAKIGMTMFAQIMPAFLIFLQYYILTNYKKTIITNKQLKREE